MDLLHFSPTTWLFPNPKLLIRESQTKANETELSLVTISCCHRLMCIQTLGQKEMRIMDHYCLAIVGPRFYWLPQGWQLTFAWNRPVSPMLYPLISPFHTRCFNCPAINILLVELSRKSEMRKRGERLAWSNLTTSTQLLIGVRVRIPNPDSFCLVTGLKTHPAPPQNAHICTRAVLVRFSVVVINTMIKSNLERKGFTGYSSHCNKEENTEARTQRTNRNPACWFVPLGFFNFLSCTSSFHLPREGTSPFGLGPLH